MNKKTIRIAGAQKSFPVGAIQKNKQTILDIFGKHRWIPYKPL